MKTAAAVLVAVLTAGLAGCASLPAKQRAVLSLQATQTHLELVQDLERRLCNAQSFDVDPTRPITECAGPVATALQLTTERHRVFAGHMATAYAAQRRLGAALLLWQPGSPVPAEVSTVEAQVRAALAVARSLVEEDERRDLIDAGEALLDEVLAVVDILRD